MIFDTDVFLWVQRGHPKAAAFIEAETERFLSVQTYLELFQGARNKKDQTIVKQFLADLDFTVLPLNEAIGHRAMVYVEEYGLSAGLRAGNSLIAATATENNEMLGTANERHCKPIQGLRLKIFQP
jgi:predicted nucleic acid-binding protein